MSIGRICCRSVDQIDQNESVREAARRMRDREVGMLVATDDVRRPVGIVTALDLVVRALADERDAAAMPVRTVMTPNPRMIAEEAPIESAASAMMFGSIRQLLVVDLTGKVVGVVTLDDVTALLAKEFSMIGTLLDSQMPHRHHARDATLAL